jgi:hypothetical protein
VPAAPAREPAVDKAGAASSAVAAAVKKWSDSGQTAVKQRSNSGQTEVKRWSRQTISFIDCSM